MTDCGAFGSNLALSLHIKAFVRRTLPKAAPCCTADTVPYISHPYKLQRAIEIFRSRVKFPDASLQHNLSPGAASRRLLRVLTRLVALNRPASPSLRPAPHAQKATLDPIIVSGWQIKCRKFPFIPDGRLQGLIVG